MDLLEIRDSCVARLDIVRRVLLLLCLSMTERRSDALGDSAAFLNITVLIRLASVALRGIILLVLLTLLMTAYALDMRLCLLIRSLIIGLSIVMVGLITAIRDGLRLEYGDSIRRRYRNYVLLRID